MDVCTDKKNRQTGECIDSKTLNYIMLNKCIAPVNKFYSIYNNYILL